MTDSQEKYKKFWEALRAKLQENGNPFFFTERAGKHYAAVNCNSSTKAVCLAIDFLPTKGLCRVDIYIDNNIDLFECLLAKKEILEEKMGFSLLWKDDCRGTTRRICYEKILFDTEHIDYERVAEKTIPIVNKFLEVFQPILYNN